MGFKADECDNQPITDTRPFNYPYATVFPSGIDGEQMTQLYGYFQQRSLLTAFKARNQRTWSDVRATTALAAPLPFNLYSDAYTFDEYLRQLVNASFTGLLWSPEVREARTLDELLNRVAMSAFAPQMCFNLWFMPHPLWEQYDAGKNKAGQTLTEPERQRVAENLRSIVNQRYQLLPYLYASFHRYHTEGLPPVRSLLLDFPDNPDLRQVDNAFLFGDSLLVAPLLGNSRSRRVVLPHGLDWYELKSGRRHAGGSAVEVAASPGEVPIFVKENSLVPLAEPVPHVERDTLFKLTVRVYGPDPAPTSLLEDDGETYDFEKGAYNRVTLSWSKAGGGKVAREGSFPGRRYEVVRWDVTAPDEVSGSRQQP
jgi:alpha-D-xyloside xylohydrolase